MCRVGILVGWWAAEPGDGAVGDGVGNCREHEQTHPEHLDAHEDANWHVWGQSACNCTAFGLGTRGDGGGHHGAPEVGRCVRPACATQSVVDRRMRSAACVRVSGGAPASQDARRASQPPARHPARSADIIRGWFKKDGNPDPRNMTPGERARQNSQASKRKDEHEQQRTAA